MVIAVAVWSTALIPGKPVSVLPPCDLKITNAALGEEITDNNSRTTVKVTYKGPFLEEDDEPEMNMTVLCSLTPGKIEQSTVDITIGEDEEFVFEVTGKNTIYLTGNYIDQKPTYDGEGFGDEESDSENGYDLRDVSSDVELNPDELDELESDGDRFEEVVEAKQISLKRSHDDSMDVDTTVVKTSKKAKKQKGGDGQAVAAITPAAETGDEANKQEVKDETKKSKKDKKKNKEAKNADATESMPSKSKELPGGLKINDIKTGTGPQAKKGSTVLMRYIGKLDNGKVFDKNTKGKPFSFRLGAGDVIKGWDEGIVGMQVGGERKLVIPPALAYGKKKTGDIPPGSTLNFEVKLIEIK
jgi:FK506-binding nuclear protein